MTLLGLTTDHIFYPLPLQFIQNNVEAVPSLSSVLAEYISATQLRVHKAYDTHVTAWQTKQ